MRRIIVFIFCLGFIIATLGIISAEDFAEDIVLYLGEVRILSVNTPSRIVVGNPQVADVTVASETEITLLAKALGTTTFTFWDNFGEQAYNIRVVSEDINSIKRRVDNLLSKLNLPEVYAQLDIPEGKTLLLGRVKTIQDKDRLATVLAPFKDNIIDLIVVKEEEAIIEIDVQVLELSKDATKTLGLTWPGSISLTEIGSPGIADVGTKWSTLFKVLNLKRASPFSFTLDALVQEGKAQILSRPRLACQSGKEAELLVGGETPIFTTQVASGGGEGTSVDYKEYGIKLRIRPSVVEENRLKLALNIEVSEIGIAETIGPSATATTAKASPLTKRAVSTELYLNNGQTMAIGGLIKQKSAEDLRKFPWLADIPVLGLFFRKKTITTGGGQGARGNTELFIILTPKIVSSKIESREAKKDTGPVMEKRPAGQDISTPLARYTNLVQKRILENLTYPASAKEAGFHGTVKLSLVLSYRGELLKAKIKQSSGYNMLDDNALKVAKETSSYPPFPSSITAKEISVEVPITYRLD